VIRSPEITRRQFRWLRLSADQGDADAAAALAAVAQAQTRAKAQDQQAKAEGTRIALVIGNSAYRAVPRLPNSIRDARSVAQSLREVGFSVKVETDLTDSEMRRALREFAARAAAVDWAVVYYAGHGIEIGGENYLIPTDAGLKSDRDVAFEAVSLKQVLGVLAGARKLRLVILDACRDNPFLSQMSRGSASRSIGRGLARVEPEADTLIVYSAKAGQIAQDGDGENSPFTYALVKRLAEPRLEISMFFRRVRDDVLAATARKQEPATYGSLGGEELFFRTK
jgi:uncharacterized caspase-like protein